MAVNKTSLCLKELPFGEENRNNEYTRSSHILIRAAQNGDRGDWRGSLAQEVRTGLSERGPQPER